VNSGANELIAIVVGRLVAARGIDDVAGGDWVEVYGDEDYGLVSSDLLQSGERCFGPCAKKYVDVQPGQLGCRRWQHFNLAVSVPIFDC